MKTLNSEEKLTIYGVLVQKWTKLDSFKGLPAKERETMRDWDAASGISNSTLEALLEGPFLLPSWFPGTMISDM